jgi:hypothetical protein
MLPAKLWEGGQFSKLSKSGNIKPLYWREKAQMISLNCGMTHCPGKIRRI